jgi:glutamate-1-semialdehyde 2,1-aminomutase
MKWILPRRELHGLHLPFPMPQDGDTAALNAWVSQEVRKDPLARGEFIVRPTDDPEWVRDEVRRLALRGLKPFSTYSSVQPPNMAELPDYLPEPIVAVAHEEGWTITLHMTRPRSAADPSNIHWIRTYCTRYPHMHLILDHSARGFNPYHALEGLEQLQGLDNLWVDTSVNCLPLATMAALRYLGPERVLYGSDYYCCHIRGTNLPVGDTFMWLDETSPIWGDHAWSGGMHPTLVGLENLRAVKAAFWALGLSDREIEAYFWGNAAALLDIA